MRAADILAMQNNLLWLQVHHCHYHSIHAFLWTQRTHLLSSESERGMGEMESSSQ